MDASTTRSTEFTTSLLTLRHRQDLRSPCSASRADAYRLRTLRNLPTGPEPIAPALADRLERTPSPRSSRSLTRRPCYDGVIVGPVWRRVGRVRSKGRSSPEDGRPVRDHRRVRDFRRSRRRSWRRRVAKLQVEAERRCPCKRCVVAIARGRARWTRPTWNAFTTSRRGCRLRVDRLRFERTRQISQARDRCRGRGIR